MLCHGLKPLIVPSLVQMSSTPLKDVANPDRKHDVRLTAQVSGPASNGYESLLPNGANTVQMGAIAIAGMQGALTPVSVTVGGDACALTVEKNPYE